MLLSQNTCRGSIGLPHASRAEGVAAVTTVPAALLGRTRLLAPGEPGDLTILDENLGVAGTVVAGDPDQRLAERDA